jgi:outer membrane protein assembly factor BamE (lipoprotein component of BamABCDE complex)
MQNRIMALLIVFALSLSGSSCSFLNQAQSQPRAQVQSSNDTVPAVWSQLHKGLDQNQVKALLGPPTYIRNSGTQLFWFYEYGTLTFDGAASENSLSGTDGRLMRWMRE